MFIANDIGNYVFSPAKASVYSFLQKPETKIYYIVYYKYRRYLGISKASSIFRRKPIS